MECVAERDIDLLLLEELHVSAAFRSWLVSQVVGPDSRHTQFLGAWHSVSRVTLGESDLVVLFADGSGSKFALLIENKINAQPQPEQAARYRERGLAGIGDGSWTGFRTCMTAPQAYLKATADAAGYDVGITYESVRDWFRQADPADQRSAYRAWLLEEAIKQNRRGYQSTPHAGVTKFWFDYWQIANTDYPELRMNKPGLISAGSDWPEFRNAELGPQRRIIHKLTAGAVDLEITAAGGALEELRTRNQPVLAEGVDLVLTGKSASFRVRVKKVDRFADVSVQIEAVREGLSAASRLLQLSPQIVVAESSNMSSRGQS
jgi:hypothetical protein